MIRRRRPAAPLIGLLLVFLVAACGGESVADGLPKDSATVTVTVPAQATTTAPTLPASPPVAEPTDPDAAGSSDDLYPYENTAPEVSVAEDTIAWPTPPADPTDAVTAAVAAAAEIGIEQAVVIIDRNSGAVLTQINPEEPYPALSLVKLMIAADVLAGGATGTDVDDPTAQSGRPSGTSSTPAPRASTPQRFNTAECVRRSSTY